MPRILVTNDDGIYSEGLRKLAGALRPLGEIIIVAPDREQSAASHALTLNRPLRLLQLETNEWIVDGTPTDCVRSEEHTSELQSLAYLVCRLLLEKKKKRSATKRSDSASAQTSA